MPPSHLAIPVREVEEAGAFGGLLGCPAGRSADAWADFDFFGHQLVCHLDVRGQVGAQATLFFLDPSGNAIEIKAFKDVAGQLFAV